MKQILDAKGIDIHANWVGEYATSLEMAGASVSLLKLDDELIRLLDHPCRTPALTVGVAAMPPVGMQRSSRQAHVAKTAVVIDRATLDAAGRVTPEIFLAMMRAVAATIRAEKDWLSKLDGVIGDGDHGVTMDIGWTAVNALLDGQPADTVIAERCERIAQAFLTAVGASSDRFMPAPSAAARRCARPSQSGWTSHCCLGERHV